MAFVGEDTYRQALADADRYESISASVRVVDLKNALAEIDRLTVHLQRANSHAERFEREWYLRGDEVERLSADLRRSEKLISMFDQDLVAHHRDLIEQTEAST